MMPRKLVMDAADVKGTPIRQLETSKHLLDAMPRTRGSEVISAVIGGLMGIDTAAKR
jgi:hypothetical protein